MSEANIFNHHLRWIGCCDLKRGKWSEINFQFAIQKNCWDIHKIYATFSIRSENADFSGHFFPEEFEKLFNSFTALWNDDQKKEIAMRKKEKLKNS